MNPELPTVESIVDTYLPRIDSSQALAMTAPTERAYCRWAAEEYFSGKGELVELGCWLGSLTRELARGLLANRRLQGAPIRIHVVDEFKWLPQWDSLVEGSAILEEMSPGDDYRELYLELISEYREFVSATAADLNSYDYTGDPIELLVVDVMKTPLLTKNISEQYFPALIPGSALVINQDYLHFGHPWIHVAAYHLRDSLEVVHVVPTASMVVFRAVGKVEVHSELAAAPGDYDRDEIEAAYAWNRSVLPERVHDILAAAEVQLLIHRGEFDDAAALYRTYARGPYRRSGMFKKGYEFDNKGFDGHIRLSAK